MCFKSASQPSNQLERGQAGLCYLAENKLVLSEHWEVVLKQASIVQSALCPENKSSGAHLPPL